LICDDYTWKNIVYTLCYLEEGELRVRECA
jgi:hypothetical protein